VACAVLLREKSTVGWLVAIADLMRKKSIAD